MSLDLSSSPSLELRHSSVLPFIPSFLPFEGAANPQSNCALGGALLPSSPRLFFSSFLACACVCALPQATLSSHGGASHNKTPSAGRTNVGTRLRCSLKRRARKGLISGRCCLPLFARRRNFEEGAGRLEAACGGCGCCCCGSYSR